MAWRTALLRMLSLGALAATAWAGIAWGIAPRWPDAASRTQFPLLQLQLFPSLKEQAPGWVVPVAFGTTLAAALIAAALSAWCAIRAARAEAARRLAIALAFGALVVDWFWVFRELDPWRAVVAPASLPIDVSASAMLMLAPIALIACFRIYPAPLGLDLVARTLDAQGREMRDRIVRIRDGLGGYRFWRWLPSEKYGGYGRRQAPGLAGIARFLRSRELVWILVVAAASLAGALFTKTFDHAGERGSFWAFMGANLLMLGDPVLGARVTEATFARPRARARQAAIGVQLGVSRLGRWPWLVAIAATGVALALAWRLGSAWSSPLVALVLVVFGIVTFGHAMSVLFMNWRHGAPDDRRRIAWIFLGTAGAMCVWMAAITAILLPAMARGLVTGETDTPGRPAMVALATIGPPAVLFAFVLSLWFSVLGRSTFDPALALRRGTGLAILGVVLTGLFVALEGMLSSQVVMRLGMPSQASGIAAGTIVALLFVPLRTRVDRGVSQLVQRLLPPEALAAGARRECVVAFSDLSGYTRLSETDESEALVLAGTLHRAARRIAPAHGGRVVKTIGDAVLVVFDDATRAIAAIAALHAEYERDAASRATEELPVHTGMHAGDVVVAPDGDVFGATVNLAARVQGLAGANELVATTALAEAIARAGLRADALPARRFRNVAEPVDCLRVSFEGVDQESSPA